MSHRALPSMANLHTGLALRIQNARGKTTVDLSSLVMQWSEFDVSAFLCALQHPEVLETLNLSKNIYINDVDVRNWLVPLITRLPGLVELDLSVNAVGTMGVLAVVRALPNHDEHKVLNLSTVGIGGHWSDVSLLLSTICELLTNLVELDLSKNPEMFDQVPLGDVDQICFPLKLKKLSISACGISDEHADALVPVLEELKDLEELTVSTGVQDKFIAALSRCRGTPPPLTVIGGGDGR